MTKLDYLLYLKSNKGILIKDQNSDETKLDELTSQDREDLIRFGYIFIDDIDDNSFFVLLTDSGEEFLESLY